jgi:CheY-like chemotaxis protein
MTEPEFVMGKRNHTIPASLKKAQLLVVDDDKAMREVLSRTLSYMGYDVTLAGYGLEAATFFFTGAYDLVMTDFRMPLMNGLELSRLVKEQSPTTPVIVITGLSEDGHLEMLHTKHVDAIIPKPFKLEEIEKTVQRLLDNET